MIANSVAPISGSLRAQVQQLRAAALSKQEFESLDPDVIGSLIDILDQAENVFIVLADEEERVQTNTDLSEPGKIKAMTKAVKSAHDKLQIVGKKGDERRHAYEQEHTSISAAPKPSSDSLVSAMRELDIQRRWQAAPLHEQMKAYKIASDNGWASTMRALKDVEVFGEDPRLTSYIQRVDQERFEVKEPKRASRLKALKYSAEVLQALAMGIDFRLSGYAEIPSFQGKPTGTTDLGFQDTQQAPPKSKAADKPEPVGAFQ